jgi:type II secretory pathway component PulF
MPQYRYRGFDEAGGRVEGVVEALSRDSALQALRSRGVFPNEVAPVAGTRDWRSSLGISSTRIQLSDLEFFTSELSLLLDSGVRIDRAIAILQRSGKSGSIGGLLTELLEQLKQGKQLSQAIGARPDVFSPLYINLVSLGEAGGRLPEVFKSLAADLRFQRELRQKIISAATYPIVVAGVCLVAIIFIFNFVVPNLQSLFAENSELPWYTSLLLNSSEFMQRWQFVIGGLVVLLGIVIWRSRKHPDLIDFRDQLLLNLPIVRDATSMIERIRFCSGLGLMLEAGLPVDRALTLAAGSIRHGVLRREISRAIEKIRRGEQVSQALKQTRIFPEYFTSLLEVGEESGALARVFLEIARRSRDDFSSWALRMTTLLEPLLVLIMGLIVGAVVVVMMLSITSVADLDL